MTEKELNSELYNQIENDIIDLGKIEYLLKQGANPLNNTDEEFIFDMFCFATDNKDLSNKLSSILELCFEYGMDISNYTDSLMSLTWNANENGIKAFLLFQEHGLPLETVIDTVGTMFTDIDMCDGSDIGDLRFYDYTVYKLKMIMLAASYKNIIDNSEDFKRWIDYNDNNYDLTKFRNWNDFEYQFDLSNCTNIEHGLQNAFVSINEISSGKTVWRFYL